jgi:hypothetical protein
MKHDTSKNISNLNAKSITPSGYFGDDECNIVEILDAVTKDEIYFLLNFAKENKNFDKTETEYNEDGNMIYEASNWDNRVVTSKTFEKYAPEIPPVLNNIVTRMQKTIENFFSVKVIPTGPCVVKWPPGSRQEPHADKEMHEGPDSGKPNAFPWYDIGTVFYLNDDYEGGELYFPLQGIEFKPKPGAAYFFPGDKNYIHGVRPILSGTRYTLPYFWTVTGLLEKSKKDVDHE